MEPINSFFFPHFNVDLVQQYWKKKGFEQFGLQFFLLPLKSL